MALTVNSNSMSNGMPSAPLRLAKANVDLDSAYPAGGYDLSAVFPGQTVVGGPWFLSHDGAALYHLRVVDDGGTPKLMVHDNASGAPGAETSTADQSGHTGVDVYAFVE
jgi:hypothetical protein